MFNQTTILAKSNMTNISNYNSVGGTLVKSTQGSKIIRFHMKSHYADTFFDINKPYYLKNYDNIYIEVLQVMLCGGDNYLVEYIEL